MDESALERAKAGDRQALEELLEEVAPLVYRFGSRMCRHEADAEDVVQDTLLSIASHLNEFEGRSSLSSWVFALARTACARKRRGLKHRPHLPEEAAGERAADGLGPDTALEQRELRAQLEAALDALSYEHREVLLLRDVEGLTAPEVAAALGTSVDAVKSRLHRARSAFRDAFDPAAASPTRRRTKWPDVVAAFSSKLEEDLEPCDCEQLAADLASCVDCEAASAALQSALGACRSVEQGPVPPEVRERVRAALEGLARKPS